MGVKLLVVLRLIRFQNLAIIALGMYMMRIMVVEPLLILSRQAPSITSLNFFLLVLSTVLIAAGGYVINDLQDIKIDKLNQRNNVVAKESISKDEGFNIYIFLTFIGICIGFYLTLRANINLVMYVNLITAGLLYFYSSTYKKQFLIGNIIVSVLTALSIAIVYLIERSAPAIESLKYLATGYVVFAFLLSMAREIIKDMEDINGDAAEGCKTLPVVAGIKAGKTVACLFLLVLLTVLITIQLISHQWEFVIPFLYVAVFIEIPLIILFVSVIISKTKADFKRCSAISKIIMLTGILSMPVFFYSF